MSCSYAKCALKNAGFNSGFQGLEINKYTQIIEQDVVLRPF